MTGNNTARGALAMVLGCVCFLLAQSAAHAQSNFLSFSSANYSVSESGSNIDITVVRTDVTNGVVTVNFATSNGTATASTDYVATNGVLTFADGQTTNSFSVVILDDLILESNETVNLMLSNPGGGASLGSVSNAVLTIIDSGTPIVQFATPTNSVNETNGTATITLIRTGGTNVAVTVDFATTNGTATAGSDYTATNGTVTFNPGETTNTFDVTILDDLVVESDETINLVLSNAVGGAILGAVSNAVLTILDNEPPSLQFSTNRYSQIEGAGSATITVTRFGSTAATATVDYATADGTAIKGSDYLAATGTLNFAPGEGTKTFSITIRDDSIFESNETVNITLSNPTGATLGSPSAAVLTILNDDRQIVTFPDADGDLVTVTLTGHGAMEISLAHPNTGPVNSIFLSATDESSKLTIRVKRVAGGDGLLEVGEIVGDGALRMLDAKACDLVGNGVDLAGQITNLASTISFHAIGDGTTNNLGSVIKKLTAARIGSSVITAPEIGSLNVKGDKRRGIAGDFEATLALTGGTTTNGVALAKLAVNGAINNAIVTVGTGDVGNVRAAAMHDSKVTTAFVPTDALNPLAGGTFASNSRIGSVNISGPSAAFANSFIIAPQVGRVALGSVETDNFGLPFGVFVSQSISSVTVRTPRFRWNRNGADDQSLGDFHVKR